jgi:hypothetical protein
LGLCTVRVLKGISFVLGVEQCPRTLTTFPSSRYQFSAVVIVVKRTRDSSIHPLLAHFIESLTAPSNSSMCFTCLHEMTRVQHLRMPNSPWLWFQIDRDSTCMAPSLTIPIEGPGQCLTNDLCAIIYNGENYFIARMRDPSNRW